MTELLDYDFDGDSYDATDDARIDAWHAGYEMYRRGQPCPDHDDDMRDGWREAKHVSLMRVELPARAEGYYHMPIGSFD